MDHWSDPKSHSLFLFPVLPWWTSSSTTLTVPFLCSHPLLFLMLVQITCITCGQSKIFPVLKHSSSYTPVVRVLLQTLAALPLTSVGLKPSPSSRSSLTVAVSFLHSPSYFFPTLVPDSLRREDTCVRELCEQLALLNPMSQQCWSASGATHGIQEISSLGCVHVALDTSSGVPQPAGMLVYSMMWRTREGPAC